MAAVHQVADEFTAIFHEYKNTENLLEINKKWRSFKEIIKNIVPSNINLENVTLSLNWDFENLSVNIVGGIIEYNAIINN